VLVEQQLVPLAVLQGLAQGPLALRILVPEHQGLALRVLQGPRALAQRLRALLPAPPGLLEFLQVLVEQQLVLRVLVQQ